MNRRQIVLAVLVVIAVHGLLFAWVSGWRVLPKMASLASVASPAPTPAEFRMREARWSDAATGKEFVYHEYRVSTQLAMPDVVIQRQLKPAPTLRPGPDSSGHP